MSTELSSPCSLFSLSLSLPLFHGPHSAARSGDLLVHNDLHEVSSLGSLAFCGQKTAPSNIQGSREEEEKGACEEKGGRKQSGQRQGSYSRDTHERGGGGTRAPRPKAAQLLALLCPSPPLPAEEKARSRRSKKSKGTAPTVAILALAFSAAHVSVALGRLWREYVIYSLFLSALKSHH